MPYLGARPMLSLWLVFVSALPIHGQETEVPRTRTFSGLVAPPFPYAPPESVGISSPTLDELGDEISEWIAGEWHYDGDLVGAELLVIKSGKAIFHEAYGWSDREKMIPVRRNSIWSIKSMSKPFTATAALMLVDEGKLAPDDRVDRLIPGFTGDERIRDLLSQTSAYREGPADPGATHESLGEWVEQWAARTPSGPSGEFAYSDYNFGALGYIVERVSGLPFDRFTEERIVAPLGLVDTSTGFSDDRVWRARLNPWYRWNAENGQYDLRWPTDRSPWPFYNAAWGMFSTAMDYAVFMALWLHGGKWQETRLLSEATVEEALRPQGGIGATGRYGYGWFVDDMPLEDGRSFWHGGGDGTYAVAFPADDLIVVYMTHSRGGHHVTSLIHRVFSSDLVTHPGLDPGLHPLVWANEAGVAVSGLSAQQRSRYVGTYRTEEGPATVARVWEEGGRLHVRYGPQGVEPDVRYHLVPVGEDRFALGHYQEDGRVSVSLDPPFRVRFLVEDGATRTIEVRKREEVILRGERVP